MEFLVWFFYATLKKCSCFGSEINKIQTIIQKCSVAFVLVVTITIRSVRLSVCCTHNKMNCQNHHNPPQCLCLFSNVSYQVAVILFLVDECKKHFDCAAHWIFLSLHGSSEKRLRRLHWIKQEWKRRSMNEQNKRESQQDFMINISDKHDWEQQQQHIFALMVRCEPIMCRPNRTHKTT